MTHPASIRAINRQPQHYLCPDCGGPMSKGAKRCRDCYVADRDQAGMGQGVYSDDAVFTISRRESIITFERDGKTRNLQCFGPSRKAQIADGRAHLPGDGWKVVCLSTPVTILNDLRNETTDVKYMGNRARALREGING